MILINNELAPEQLPMTANQQGLFFLQQQHKQCAAYNIPSCFKLTTANLQVPLLIKSCQHFLQQQPALTARFEMRANQAMQTINGQTNLDFAEIDLTNTQDKSPDILSILTKQANQVFDLSQDPVCRFRLFRYAEHQYYFLLVVHHIAFDGFSSLLVENIFTTYQQLCNHNPIAVTPLETNFVEHIRQQQQWLATDQAQQQIIFWKDQLDNLPLLALPVDSPYPSIQTFTGDAVSFTISAQQANQLKQLAKSAKVTLSSLGLTAYKILLHKYTSQLDLVVGMPMLGREIPGLDKTAGYFANMLAIRSTINPHQSIAQYSHQLTQQMWRCLAHRDLPFVKLTEHIDYNRNISRPPIFQASYAFQHFSSWNNDGLPPMLKGASKSLGDLHLTSIPLPCQEGAFELTLEILWADQGDITCLLKYNTSLFNRQTITKMVERWQNILAAILRDPQQSIHTINWLSKHEKRQILHEFNQTDRHYSRNTDIFSLLQQQAQRQPNAIALETNETQLTYQELIIKVTDLATELQGIGVIPNTLIAICLPRSFNMIIGMLAVLAAGGAYLPLDPQYPIQRLQYMLIDSQTKIILSDSRLTTLLESMALQDVQIIYLDQVQQSSTKVLNSAPHVGQTTGQQLAYVIYTSGSTGQPKGVMIEHLAINRLVSDPNYLQITSNDKILQYASISFDAATFEIYGALLNGATLVLAPTEQLSNQMFGDFLQQHNISILWLTSSLFQLFIKDQHHIFNSLKTLLVGGEVVPLTAVNTLLKHAPDLTMINGYGPTENTTFTCCYSIQGEVPKSLDTVPIGKPITNTKVYILDSDLQLLPIGAIGELFTSGDGIARGYLNAQQLTEDKFIPNPYATQQDKSQQRHLRLYRTGDLCRWLPNGDIEYIGRKDNQIKLRGFRIECGEIEACLQSHPDIQRAVIVAKGTAANKYLLAFYTQDKQANLLKPTTLSDYLSQQLPAHMVPTHYQLLDQLPLTGNGKVDRNQLVAMEITPQHTDPHSASDVNTKLAANHYQEQQLLSIWQAICERQDIKTTDNFFDIGGNSLLVLSMVEQINQRLNCNITINDIFTHPTIEHLVIHIKDISPNVPPNHTTTEQTLSEHQCLHTLISRQASQNPEAIAITMGNNQLTYQELEKKSQTLAIHLQESGVLPDSLVAICVDRSIDMVIGILAILKAGGAFVPIDPQYPQQRIAFLLNDCQAQLLLTQSHLAGELKQIATELIEIICLDEDRTYQPRPHQPRPHQNHPYKNNNIADLKQQTQPHHLAYVIYTSGSTGQPKGVMIEHRSVINLCEWHNRRFAVTANDNTTLFASIAFDAAVWELFPYLLAGANVHILSDEIRSNAFDIQQYFIDHKINIAFLTTQMCQFLLAQPSNEFLTDHKLRYLLTGGDQLICDPSQPHRFTLVNNYGPTENSVVTTSGEISTHQHPIPIGKPIDNCQVYILDQDLNPVAAGESGELYITGIGLARGYLHSPELTREKFIDNPFNQPQTPDHTRLYKTGDLCQWRADGQIEFHGRIDHQVKIRGFRIECGEIETHLNSHPQIIEATVVVQTSDTFKHLIAFYCQSTPITPLTNGQLTEYLASRLPAHMVPADFVLIETMPLTPNGKVNRQALSEYQVGVNQGAIYMPPRDEIECKLIAIWQRVFQRDHIGIHDDFFDIGGDSLSIMSLVEKINTELCPDIKIADVTTGSTVEKMAELIKTNHSIPLISDQSLNELTGIAIIGMSCRLPGANTITEYWNNLKAGIESISRFSTEQLIAAGVKPQVFQQDNYVNAKGYLDSLKLFDADFFNYSPREAQTMDPQQRLFLEQSYHAIEDAGYNPFTYQGKIGVYAGSGFNNYRSHIENNIQTNNHKVDFQMIISNGPDFLASRVAYKLNLKGPAVVVQTACSTSLVAVKQACKALNRDTCDIAIAGGVSLPGGFETDGYLYQPGMILSPDGHCRPFDAQAQGTVPGHGVGIVVLKDLKHAVMDGDNVRAVIKAAAINNDGAIKVGYTAPSVEGQRQVINAALKKAKITPDKISYIETHGTATPMGDPIELQTLKLAFEATQQGHHSCAIGSVKGNIGHTDAAAGVVGLIKTVLCLEHRTLVPTINYQQANPALNLTNSPFYVNTETKHWPTQENRPRIAGVSAFGIGGTNAHLIVAEAPKFAIPPCHKRYHLLVLSAKTAKSLKNNIEYLYQQLLQQKDPQSLSIADIAYSLQIGRAEFDYRQALVVDQALDLKTQIGNYRERLPSIHLTKAATRPQIVLMFSGQGSQYTDMGLDLYKEQVVFRNAVDTCCSYLNKVVDYDLKSIIYPTVGSSSSVQSAEVLLNQTQHSQIALFVIQYAYAKLWLSYGLQPDALIGHSIGEYVAASIAGVIGLEDSLRLIYRRGQLMQSLPSGAMLAIELSEQQLTPYIKHKDDIEIAIFNHPQHCVVSGNTTAIDRLANRLSDEQIKHHKLATSHAFHSQMMEPIMTAFAAEMNKIQLHPPKIKYVSSLTGTWITTAQATDNQYWCEQLRHPVQFWQGLTTIYRGLNDNQSHQLLIEIGAGKVLSSLAKRHPHITQTQHIIASSRHQHQQIDDNLFFLNALGKLWQAGAKVSWDHLYATEKRKRVSLPGYAFESQEHWLTNQQSIPKTPTESQGSIWKNITINAIATAERMHSGIITFSDKQHFNGAEIIKTIMSALSQHLPSTATLNILEISSDSDELATIVLPLLPANTTQYDFTYTNPKTWHGANNYFKRYTFFNCKSLNIALSPQIQGFGKYNYDLVIAGTSLHKSNNIDDVLKNTRSLLAPGGILLIWEFCNAQPHTSSSISQLLEYPNDSQYTQSHPFGSCEPWCEALLARGFDKTQILADAAVIGQNILLARADSPQPAFSDQIIAETAPEQTPQSWQHEAWDQRSDKQLSNHQPLSNHQSLSKHQPLSRHQSPARHQASSHNYDDQATIKTKIKQVWQHYLGVKEITDQDDFFALGGDSLIAINVIAKLQEIFQQNLSFASLIEYTTIDALARLITTKQSHLIPPQRHRTESSLISIQQGDPQVEPLFLVHPAGGQVYFYRDLAQALGEMQPIYGIQSLMTDNGQQLHLTIEEMASCYIEDLRKKYPNKQSFILGGASLGGIIANEMAHQLKDQGIIINALVIIDAPGPNYMPTLYRTTAELLIYLADNKIRLSQAHLETLNIVEQIEYVRQAEVQSAHSAIFPPNLNVEYLETLKAQNIAMHRYQFKPFYGNAIYFKHSERMAAFPKDMYKAWENIVTGELLIYSVSGTHISMNMLPHVAEIANHLTPWLARFQSKTDQGKY